MTSHHASIAEAGLVRRRVPGTAREHRWEHHVRDRAPGRFRVFSRWRSRRPGPRSGKRDTELGFLVAGGRGSHS